MKIGYIRVSTTDQNTDRQLEGVPLDRVFEDKLSGKNTERPALQELLRFARDGDTVTVHSLDRLARNLDDLRKIVGQLTERGVVIEFAKERLRFAPGASDPTSLLMLSILGAFAEFERQLMLQRQAEGIALAKAKGVYKGRKPVPDEKVTSLRRRVADGEPVPAVAKELNIGRSTAYRLVSNTLSTTTADCTVVRRRESTSAPSRPRGRLVATISCPTRCHAPPC